MPVIPICLVTQNERSAALSSAAILSKEPRPASSAVIFAIRAVFPAPASPSIQTRQAPSLAASAMALRASGNFRRPDRHAIRHQTGLARSSLLGSSTIQRAKFWCSIGVRSHSKDDSVRCRKIVLASAPFERRLKSFPTIRSIPGFVGAEVFAL